MVGIAEQVVPFMDRNLDAQLPLALVLGAVAEEDANSFAMRGTNPATLGGTAVVPCEYRGVAMGPLILGSFGFTQHVLFNERSAGLWFAALPHAPNSHALLAPHDLRGDLDFAGVLERRTPSVALCSDEGRSEPSAIAGHYNDLAGGACTPGRVSLRTLSRERAALATELGSWAQASLRIKADGDGRVVATLSVSIRDDEGLQLATVTARGRYVMLGDRRTLTLSGPVLDADAPLPRDDGGDPRCGACGWISRARDQDTFGWPPPNSPSHCEAFELHAEVHSGILIVTLRMESASPFRTVKNAILALDRLPPRPTS